ncbi:MAG: radical SAM protein [Theionarchaea archaeon]|nr:radical SAM protein [Theionarchaea archaeon]MBU7001924.1 radical SAM protein [Theionarchaea archaeon]MBU7020411.1 radical SAM protein [Theionarchaea archaeon]
MSDDTVRVLAMDETHTYIRWSDTSVWEELEGRILICRLPELDFVADLRLEEDLIWLNHEGSQVWNLCDGTRTAEEIVLLLFDTHNVDYAVLKKDVTTLIQTLHRRGYLEFREEKAPYPHVQSIDQRFPTWSESVLWNDMEEEVGLLDCTDGTMVFLGPSEGELWKMCNGTRTMSDIIAQMRSGENLTKSHAALLARILHKLRFLVIEPTSEGLQEARGKRGRGEAGEKALNLKVLSDHNHFLVQHHITGKCNLRCRHCYEDERIQEELSTRDTIAIIDKCFATLNAWGYEVHLILSGGEPLLRDDFWEIMDHVQACYNHTCPNTVSIMSNGTLLDRRTAARLSEYTALGGVQISLDGTKKETHDKIRGKGNFQRSLRALTCLTEENITTSIHFVVHKENYDDAFEITDLATHYNVNLCVTRLVPYGRGKEMESSMLSPNEVFRLFRKLSNDEDILSHQRARNETSTFISRFRCDWPVTYAGDSIETSELSYPFTKNGGRCQIGRGLLAIMQDGTVYPCRRLPVPVGNLLEEELPEIWNNLFFWKMRRKNRYMTGKCAQCEFNCDGSLDFSCSGGASCISYGYYGDPFQPDPGCLYNPEIGSFEVCNV